MVNAQAREEASPRLNAPSNSLRGHRRELAFELISNKCTRHCSRNDVHVCQMPIVSQRGNRNSDDLSVDVNQRPAAKFWIEGYVAVKGLRKSGAPMAIQTRKLPFSGRRWKSQIDRRFLAFNCNGDRIAGIN